MQFLKKSMIASKFCIQHPKGQGSNNTNYLTVTAGKDGIDSYAELCGNKTIGIF
jgi:hypothetical protein